MKQSYTSSLDWKGLGFCVERLMLVYNFCAILRISVSHALHLPATDGGALPGRRTRRIGRGNLEITDVVREDGGLYHCSLDGEPDSFAEALLTVLGK